MFTALRPLPVLLAFALAATSLSAATWHVDARSGDDSADGRSSSAALRTIQAAADRVAPGDVVLVVPGVYHESVTITRRGTADAPITFRAADPRPGAVVVTGAAPDIRAGRATWELVDADLHLYRTRHADGWPARVLYDNTDLYPYAGLDRLKTFAIHGAPGPRHGYFYDADGGWLYLRLNPRHASRGLDPASYIIAVAPPTGDGFEGTLVTRPAHFNFGIPGEGPAHIVIEGFTFETPGVAGVYTEAGHVTVRDAWFYGCRTAVCGNYREAMHDPDRGYVFKNLRHDVASLDRVAGDVTLARVFFTQFPTFGDILDCIQRLPADLPAGRAGRTPRYVAMWHRKSVGNGLPSEHFKYEIGVACRIGRGWTIEDSVIVDAFEGLSCHAVAGSENLVVRRNLFARLTDNAVETEDWARGMQVTDNVILDVMEPFSWQPLRGLPWPTDIVFSRNIIANTPEHSDAWAKVLPGRGAFKIGAPLSNWTSLPWMADVPRSPLSLGGGGIEISHNLVWFPGGRLFTLLGDRKTAIPDIRLHDNLLAADRLSTAGTGQAEMSERHFTFARNLSLPTRENLPGPGLIAAGEGGEISEHAPAAGLPHASAFDFQTAPNSPASRLRIPSVDLRPLLIFDFDNVDPATFRWPPNKG